MFPASPHVFARSRPQVNHFTNDGLYDITACLPGITQCCLSMKTNLLSGPLITRVIQAGVGEWNQAMTAPHHVGTSGCVFVLIGIVVL